MTHPVVSLGVNRISTDIPMPDGTQPPARSRFLSRWAFRDRVYIDGDRSIVAVITEFSFTEASMPTARAVWFSNGDSKEGWFEEWRLSEAET